MIHTLTNRHNTSNNMNDNDSFVFINSIYNNNITTTVYINVYINIPT